MPGRNRRSPFPAPSRPLASDSRLGEALQRSASGDIDALQELYELAAPRLLAMLMQTCVDRDAAELQLQETIVRVWQQARAFNPLQMQPWEWLQRLMLPAAASTADVPAAINENAFPPVRPDEATWSIILARIEAGSARQKRGGQRYWTILAVALALVLLLTYLSRTR
jgi:hypothetical protein